jgi:hypothetical protein
MLSCLLEPGFQWLFVAACSCVCVGPCQVCPPSLPGPGLSLPVALGKGQAHGLGRRRLGQTLGPLASVPIPWTLLHHQDIVPCPGIRRDPVPSPMTRPMTTASPATSQTTWRRLLAAPPVGRDRLGGVGMVGLAVAAAWGRCKELVLCRWTLGAQRRATRRTDPLPLALPVSTGSSRGVPLPCVRRPSALECIFHIAYQQSFESDVYLDLGNLAPFIVPCACPTLFHHPCCYLTCMLTCMRAYIPSFASSLC